MKATTHPPEREDEAEPYVNKLDEALPEYLSEAVETAAERGESVSIYGAVDDARVVVDLSPDLGPEAHVEFERYEGTGVRDLNVDFQP